MRRKLNWSALVALALLASACVWVVAQEVPPSPSPTVVVLTLDGVINTVTADYVKKGMEQAEKMNAAYVVLELNTPGGLLDPTREITADILHSSIPVVVFVSPPGGRAASAGTFITLSAHVAAMAPSTNIGSASPIEFGMSGEKTDPSSVEYRKALNDVLAFVRSLCEQRDRPVDWGIATVKESRNDSAKQALEAGAVDLMAVDTPDLTRKLAGREVRMNEHTVTLPGNVRLHRLPMNLIQRFLLAISHPSIALVLMSLALMGLVFELSNPGAVLPGVAGAICLVLAFYSFSTFPVNIAGVLLIVLAIGLFIADIKLPSHGMLTLGGAISLLMGSLMLVASSAEYLRISLLAVGTSVGLTTAFFAFCVTKGLQAQFRKVITGSEGLVGLRGVAITDVGTEGTIFLEGSNWRARAESGTIPKGERVQVVAVEGLTLTVKGLSGQN